MRVLLRILPVVVLCLCAARGALADDANLRLRIVWGGGDSPQQWEGELRLSHGEFSEVQPLGLEADTPGSVVYAVSNGAGAAQILARSRLEIKQRSPRSYDGIDVLVEAPLSAVLEINLNATNAGLPPKTLSVELGELVAGEFRQNLDDLGRQLLIRRSPGDMLRIETDRGSLVFEPGEEFDFQIDPHHTSLPIDAAQRLKVALVEARGGREIQSNSYEIPVTPQADWTPIQQRITLPTAEGAYDLVLTIEKRGQFAGQFLPADVLLTRKLQVVVVSDSAPAAPPAAETVVAELDPATPDFWERLRSLPQLRRIPGIGNEPASNHRSRTFAHQSIRWTELSPPDAANDAGWVAYPLPTSGIGRLHVLEIEYPNDLPQTLGISIIEPNAAGESVPPAVDTAVDVARPPSSVAPGVARHRIYFWPRTDSPVVLLTNRQQDEPAYFGRIRILTGPQHLPPAVAPPQSGGERGVLAVFDRPLYPDVFSASEALDAETHRSLDDWKTFLDGGNRLTEYLAHTGYGGAMIAANCEGSALYPSELLQPTPKYDMGAFFTNGQDSTRKDALELLFRQFDRSGAVLVPIVQFSSPLPRLESRLREPGAEGIELTNAQGRRWLEEYPTQAGLAPYYNPLDSRVQEAMSDVVAELVERYGDHPSFGGIAVQLSDNGYAMLPGPQWGCDDATLRRFVHDTNLALPGAALPPIGQREQFLLGEQLAAWRKWRADEMTEFYEKLAEVVTQRHPHAKLYLSGSRLIDSLESRLALRPTLPSSPSASERLLSLGLDANALGDSEHVVFMRPRFYSPLATVTERGPSLVFNRDSGLDSALAGSAAAASAFHAVITTDLPEFDAANPLKATESYTYLMPIATPSGSGNRQRFIDALAASDVSILTDGGWTIPLGQDAAVSDLFVTLSRLPAGPFDTPPAAQQSPLVVRTLQQGERTYVYCLNQSAWPCTAELQVNVPGGGEFVSLHTNPNKKLAPGQAGSWSVELAPYDMVAGYFTTRRAAVQSARATLPRSAQVDLATRVEQLQKEVGAIPSLTDAPVPNGGFEQAPGAQPVPLWQHSMAAGVNVRIDPLQKQAGTQSLLIESNGPVAWVRSDRLEVPNTGRIALLVYVRTDNPQQQPRLRLAIDGSLRGRPYYRWAEVGGNQAAQLGPTWQSYELRILDLPPEGLDELRVGFDLMGPGRVWIDEVRIKPLPFLANEPNELFDLTKLAALADLKLKNGDLAACAHLLDGFWPLYLHAYVRGGQPMVAAGAQPPAPVVPRTADASTAEAAEPPEDETPWRQRLHVPKLLPWF